MHHSRIHASTCKSEAGHKSFVPVSGSSEGWAQRREKCCWWETQTPCLPHLTAVGNYFFCLRLFPALKHLLRRWCSLPSDFGYLSSMKSVEVTCWVWNEKAPGPGRLACHFSVPLHFVQVFVNVWFQWQCWTFFKLSVASTQYSHWFYNKGNINGSRILQWIIVRGPLPSIAMRAFCHWQWCHT